MTQNFKNFVMECAQRFISIVDDAYKTKNKVLFGLCVDAYNAFQENERDCLDYLFNADNNEDLICCFNGGLTYTELLKMEIQIAANPNKTRYFRFGINHREPFFITRAMVALDLKNYAEEIMENMLRYPSTYPRALYELIITNMD